MTTDFNYNNKTIDSSGPIKPSGTDQPGDPRTRVDFYSDIESIPNPYIGMIVTVKMDETNQNKMTDYKVLSLKPNSLGIANSVIDRVQKYSEYLGVSTGGSSSSGTGGAGLTEEQEERLNKIPEIETAIGDENSGLIKGLNDITTLTIPGFTPSNEIYEFDEIDNRWMTSSDNKTLAITSDEFLADWYDIYLGVHDDGLNVTKNIIGKDQSGSYYVYEYDFKPKNYTRTILLTSGTHAYELSASFGLAYFFKDLMTTPYKHDGFKYIRENVRIKVIPISNPWGYNQSPKVYANSNGVNPNRNFNFNGSWDAYPIKVNEWDYKGTAPFSEQETKNFANWLYYNKEIADFWVECHTDYNNSSYDNYIVYQSYSPLANKVKKVLEKLSNRIKSKYSVTTVNNHEQVDHKNNIIQEWSEKVIGIPMVTIEQSPLNPKWKTGNYNNNGGAIREYAVTVFAYLQEFLSCDSSSFNILDYLHKLRDDILNNSCKQIPYYASSSYPMLINAGSTGSSSGGNSTVTYTVTNNLTNVTNSNSSTSVKNGSSYIATLTASDGYSLGTVTITMGGNDITSTSYSNGSINISNVTGNIIITANATLIQTSSFALSETSISIKKGATKQLTATLGGADVTSSTNWSSNNANATVVGGLVTGVTEGNSIITATKDGESATCSVNIVDNASSNLLTCTRVGLELDGRERPSTTRISTDYIPVTITGSTMKVNYSGTYQYALRFYDSSKTCIGYTTGSSFKQGWGIGQETIRESCLTSNVAYVRFLFRADSTGTTEFNTISGTLTVNDTTYNLTM